MTDSPLISMAIDKFRFIYIFFMTYYHLHSVFWKTMFFSVDYLGKIESETANLLYSLYFEVQHLEIQQGNIFSILCLLKSLFIFSC